MAWLFERLSKSKLKMTAWLLTLFMTGAFLCLIFHKRIGLDVTILGILAGGLVGIPAALLGTRGNTSESESTTITTNPLNNNCPNCNKPLI
jgi:hypothetical protein